MSLLHELPQALESLIPLPRDLIEIVARLVELVRVKRPDAFSPPSAIVDDPGLSQGPQVLGDGLARNGGAGRKPGDRLWALGAEPVHQGEAGLVAQRGEERRWARQMAWRGARS